MDTTLGLFGANYSKNYGRMLGQGGRAVHVLNIFIQGSLIGIEEIVRKLNLSVKIDSYV